jgi:hypothetical protein
MPHFSFGFAIMWTKVRNIDIITVYTIFTICQWNLKVYCSFVIVILIMSTYMKRTMEDIKILFGEPETQFGFIKKAYYRKKRLSTGLTISVNFLETLLKKPLAKFGDESNAFVFGPLFPLAEYAFISSHHNNIGQTGLVNGNALSSKGISTLELRAIDKLIKDWFMRRPPTLTIQELREIRRITSGAIVFIGKTVGGDVGASLYAHRSSTGVIDSIIIDNNYFFSKD